MLKLIEDPELRAMLDRDYLLRLLLLQKRCHLLKSRLHKNRKEALSFTTGSCRGYGDCTDDPDAEDYCQADVGKFLWNSHVHSDLGGGHE